MAFALTTWPFWQDKWWQDNGVQIGARFGPRTLVNDSSRWRFPDIETWQNKAMELQLFHLVGPYPRFYRLFAYYTWLVVSNIFPFHKKGMSSFPLTFTPSFFKMVTAPTSHDTRTISNIGTPLQVGAIGAQSSLDDPYTVKFEGWNHPDMVGDP